MDCQRQILGVMWFHRIPNTEIIQRTKLPMKSELNSKRRLSIFDHVVRMDPRTLAHTCLKVARDMSMGGRIPARWRRRRGHPRLSWCSQIKKDTQLPLATAWTRASDRLLWRMGATAFGFAK